MVADGISFYHISLILSTIAYRIDHFYCLFHGLIACPLLCHLVLPHLMLPLFVCVMARDGHHRVSWTSKMFRETIADGRTPYEYCMSLIMSTLVNDGLYHLFFDLLSPVPYRVIFDCAMIELYVMARDRYHRILALRTFRQMVADRRIPYEYRISLIVPSLMACLCSVALSCHCFVPWHVPGTTVSWTCESFGRW